MERYKVVFEIYDARAGRVVAEGDYSSELLAPEVAVRVIGQLNHDVGKGWSHVPLDGPHQSILYDIQPVELSPEQVRGVLEQCYRRSGGPQLPNFGRRSER
jgi:hypothetical protein